MYYFEDAAVLPAPLPLAACAASAPWNAAPRSMFTVIAVLGMLRALNCDSLKTAQLLSVGQ